MFPALSRSCADQSEPWNRVDLFEAFDCTCCKVRKPSVFLRSLLASMQFGISCCWQEIPPQYLDKIEGFCLPQRAEQAVPCESKQTEQLLTTVWKWLFLWQVWHEDMRCDAHRARVSSPANGQGQFSSAAFAQMLL